MLTTHAVVLVSGGAAVTPFTTPEAGAASGLAAGNTMTALREHLLGTGRMAFSAPARVGAGEVREDTGWQGFADVPEVLPARMTVNAVGGIDEAGVALDAFLEHLAETRGIETFDLVAHSMGGLFSRAAIATGRRRTAGTRVRRLVTIGTPWTGGILGDVVAGDLTQADAQGDAATETILTQSAAYAAEYSQGAAEQVSQRYLDGPEGWNARQAGALAGIDVTVIAGSYFAAARTPECLWPHDGLVARRSALAELVPAEVLPGAASAEFDDVHSIYLADAFGLPWERALTWDPAVLDRVSAAL